MNTCTKCGDEHTRKHSWCKACVGESRRGGGAHTAAEGTPPPPPPGFLESDLTAGKPVL